MEAWHWLALRASEVVNSTAAVNPIVSTVAGWASIAVAVLQSSQEVAGTLIAFFTSIAGLVTVILSMRKAWRNRNKD